MSKKISIFLAVLCLLTAFHAEAADFHVLIITDTNAAGIEKSVKADTGNVSQKVRRIAAYTGLKLKETVLTDRDVNLKNFLNYLDNLRVGSDDVILFYFAGHGCRTKAKNETNPWPNIWFTLEHFAFDFQEVIAIFEQKGARLVLAFSDCCNNVLSATQAPDLRLLSRGAVVQKPGNSIQDNYKKLFLETSGVVMASGAKIGEFAWGNDLGGLFTAALFSNLDQEVAKGQSPNWEAILERTKDAVKKHQNPIYKIREMAGQR